MIDILIFSVIWLIFGFGSCFIALRYHGGEHIEAIQFLILFLFIATGIISFVVLSAVSIMIWVIDRYDYIKNPFYKRR